MPSNILTLLPKPPEGKTGWPWTKESKPLPKHMRNGETWPKITIVTPSYNQGQFLEETIRSVLLQNYPNLEYIIMDGGSSDNSVEIIKKYASWLTYWVSEKDNGQADAIYRGFERANGDVLAWINADDFFLADALHEVGWYFSQNRHADVLVGGVRLVDSEGKKIKTWMAFRQDYNSILCYGQLFLQMGVFWSAALYRRSGGIDSTLHFAMDYELFLKFSKDTDFFGYSNIVLAACRSHPDTKSGQIFSSVGLPEMKAIQKRHGIEKIPVEEQKTIRDAGYKRYQRNLLRPLHEAFRHPVQSLKAAVKSFLGDDNIMIKYFYKNLTLYVKSFMKILSKEKK